MRIKNRLRVNAIVSLLIAFFIGIVLVSALNRLDKANNSAIIASNIVTISFEMVSLRNDYIRRNSDRAKSQWIDKNKQITVLLKSAPEHFHKIDDRKIIGKILKDQEDSEEIFSIVVVNRQKNYSNAGLVGLHLEVEERLLNQMDIKVYETVIHGRALQDSSRQARASALRLAEGGVISALLILITAAVINLWSMSRIITDRVNRLRDGAVMIGSGNLDHKIDIKGDDEFAELSVAFNEMTAKLSGSHHDLEIEVEERKRAEEEASHLHKIIAQEKDRLSALVSSITDEIWFADSTGEFILVNPSVSREFELTTAGAFDVREFAASLEVLQADGSPRPIEETPALRALRGEIVREQEELIRTPATGELRYRQVNSAPVRDAMNNIIGSVSVVRDITERKRAEDALRENHQRLQKVLEIGTVGVMFWDLNTGCMTDANETFLNIMGYSRREVEACELTWQKLTPPEYFEVSQAEVKNFQTSGRIGPYEKEYFHKDGSRKWFVFAGSSLGNNTCVEFCVDITDRKQAEELLKTSLAEKEIMLKEIHHRVKNNLQVISSLVSLQSDNLVDNQIRDELNDVRDRIRSMALVHEKLYQSDSLAKIDFADYATSMLRALWRSHGILADKIRLNLAVEPVLMPVETAMPCGLLLNELAINALKHAFPGCSRGDVTVGLEFDAATDQVCLRVRDNGIGLPVELDWRLSPSLGLRLVQILTRQLHGVVETGMGPGTEFLITFPLKVFHHE